MKGKDFFQFTGCSIVVQLNSERSRRCVSIRAAISGSVAVPMRYRRVAALFCALVNEKSLRIRTFPTSNTATYERKFSANHRVQLLFQSSISVSFFMPIRNQRPSIPRKFSECRRTIPLSNKSLYISRASRFRWFK